MFPLEALLDGRLWRGLGDGALDAVGQQGRVLRNVLQCPAPVSLLFSSLNA